MGQRYAWKPRKCSPEDGADEMLEDFVAGIPVEVPGVRAGLSQEVANEHGVPAAQGEAEDPPAERDPEMDSFSVMVRFKV